MGAARTSDSARRKRWIAYPIAAAIVGILVWGGFFRTVQADVDTVLSSAELYARLGLLDQAEETCREALEREPDSVYGRLILGMVAERRGDCAGARALYEGLVPDVEGDLRIDLKLSCVDLHRREGRLEEASRALEAVAAELGGDDPRVLKMQGFIADDAGADEEMVAAFRGYAERAPESGEARLLLAAALVANDERAEARELLRSWTKNERGVERVWLALARSCLEAGDEEGAASALSRYGQLEPRAREKLEGDAFWSSRNDLLEMLGSKE